MTDTNNSLAARIREAIRQLRDLPGDLESEDDPAFTVEQINFLEKRLYEVRARLEAAQPNDGHTGIDLHVRQLLASHHQIAAIWSTQDVKGVRPHLTDDQAWEVLEQVGDTHDANWGICWTTIETVADDLFPEPANKKGRP